MNPMPDELLNYVVTIVSRGRAEILAATVESILRQSYLPAQILLILDAESDGVGVTADPRVRICYKTGSLSSKRNYGISQVDPATELIVFFDDDVELHPDYGRNACLFFQEAKDVVAASGEVVQDRWMLRAEAKELLQEANRSTPVFRQQGPNWTLYGCNMVIRAEAVRKELFDEALPLYSVGEDYEISIRLRKAGRVGRFSSGLLVHLKAPSARLDRRKLTWSILANHWYFVRKGSCHLPPPISYLRYGWLFLKIGKEQIALDLKEKTSQFPGLRGWVLAVKDFFLGKLLPERLPTI